MTKRAEMTDRVYPSFPSTGWGFRLTESGEGVEACYYVGGNTWMSEETLYFHPGERDQILADLKAHQAWADSRGEVNAHDPVNRPAHYTAGAIECIDAIAAALGRDGFVAYCRGNAIKYQWRAGLKGATAEDLRKAAWYAERAAKALEAA